MDGNTGGKAEARDSSNCLQHGRGRMRLFTRASTPLLDPLFLLVHLLLAGVLITTPGPARPHFRLGLSSAIHEL